MFVFAERVDTSTGKAINLKSEKRFGKITQDTIWQRHGYGEALKLTDEERIDGIRCRAGVAEWTPISGLDVKVLVEDRAWLLAQYDSLLADKKRLDWLDMVSAPDHPYQRFGFNSSREALDEAMTAYDAHSQPEEPK